MSAIDQLLELAAEYGRAAEVDTTTVSWRLFGDSKKLAAIIEGGDIQVRRFEKSMLWLAENWPDRAVWPASIKRPTVCEVAAVASAAKRERA